MGKPLLFYLIDEYTDDIKYCKRKGMIPCKFEDKELDGKIYKSAVQYSYKGYIYDVLESGKCYSGYMVTLMRLPKLSYEELFNVALESKRHSERVGAVGIILKDYPTELEHYLIEVSKKNIDSLPDKKKFKRMIVLINNLVKHHNGHVSELEKILNLCEGFML